MRFDRAPWIDRGMVQRGEITVISPFPGVAFYVPAGTPAYLADHGALLVVNALEPADDDA